MVSNDASFYGACRSCGWEHRIRPLDAMSLKNLRKRFKSQACLRCGNQSGLRMATHQLQMTLECGACQTISVIVTPPDGEVRCPKCELSKTLTIAANDFVPPYPAEFSDLNLSKSLFEAEPHIWGRSGLADGLKLVDETRLVDILPEPQRALFATFLFSLHLWRLNTYDQEGEYMVANAAGNIARSYLRLTGDLNVGAESLPCYARMIELAPDVLNRAIAQHSFAMGLFSMLKMSTEADVAEVTGLEEPRRLAIELALDSESELMKSSQDISGLETQLARVRWLIGDLILSGATENSEYRSAITYFDMAFVDHWMRENLAWALASSRAAAVMCLSDPSETEIRQAIEDLQVAAEFSNDGFGREAHSYRWRARANQATLATWLSDDLLAGLTELREAASLAIDAYSAMADEQQLIQQAEELVGVFEHLAGRYISFGWNDEALTAIEILRAASIRIYSMGKKEWNKRNADLQKARIAREMPFVEKVDGEYELQLGKRRKRSRFDIDDYLTEHSIAPAVTSLLRAHADVPTAYISMILTESGPRRVPIFSALLAFMSGKDEWQHLRRIWSPDAKFLAACGNRRYIEPGPFRERILEGVCRVGGRELLAPLMPLIEEAGAQRVMVSLPGELSALPLEAFALPDGSVAGEKLSFMVLPSVRFGADLVSASRSGRTSVPRVLGLGYADPDIPAAENELASISQFWGNQMTLIPGNDCRRSTVLDALNSGRYDIIHAVCHGTFNRDVPLNSALHFSSDATDENTTVTARDLFERVRLRNSPIIILSACSSIATADSRTNTFHGLTGSLFRVGARSIIGSRWSVDDSAAADLMRSLHAQLASNQLAADLCLWHSKDEFRRNGAQMQDWAAFVQFGVE